MLKIKNKLTIFHDDNSSFTEYSKEALDFDRDTFTLTLDSIIPNGIRLGRGTKDSVRLIVKDDLTGLIDHKLFVIGFKHIE